jgi:tRNA pseudouridine55 synthase
VTAAGVLLLDKPDGPTSHDLVSRARRALGTRRVGHAGTLDPMATGLLVLGSGTATRLLTYLVGLDKEYTATVRLGEATETDDAAGEVTARADASGVTPDGLAEAVASLTGPISQIPSTYSAVRIAGRRAYDRARAGEHVELPPRSVRVDAFEVLGERRAGPLMDLDIRVTVSSGTYVRALARDLGTALGVGGHITALRRTRVGPFRVEDAVDPDADLVAALRDPAEIASALFPIVQLDDDSAAAIAHGRRVRLSTPDAPVAAALTPDGRLAALLTVSDGSARVLAGFPVE